MPAAAQWRLLRRWSLRRYCVAPAAYVARIPDELGDVEAAPILCAGVTTYKALKVANVKPGEWVAIYGIGGLGHVALQYAKAMGYNVVAVDIHQEKLDLAKTGADLTVNGSEVDPVQAIQEQIGGVHGAISVAVTKKRLSRRTSPFAAAARSS